jgi:hypothetical protein
MCMLPRHAACLEEVHLAPAAHAERTGLYGKLLPHENLPYRMY